MIKSVVVTGCVLGAFCVFGQQPSAKEGFLVRQAYDEMQRVTGQVDLLQSNQDDLARRLSAAEKANAELREEISALRAEIGSLRSDVSAVIRDETKDLRQEIVAELSKKIVAIQKQQQASRPAPDPVVSGPYKEYVVESGDTLFVVAQACGTTVKKIKEMNGLTSDMLRVGQKLKVPVEK